MAAAGSVLLLLAALACAAFALVNDGVWRLIVDLLAVAVTVAGGWYALSRRGVGRVLGIVAVAAAVAAFVVVTVTAEYRGVLLAVTLLLAAASAVAARYALTPTEPATEASTVAVRAPRRAVLIMNPRSGGGKAERYHLEDRCSDLGIEAVVLHPGDDLEKLAVDAVGRGADIIGMAGGDGSQALVASVAAAHDLPYVCIPAGTRNHLALDLGIDRDDVVGALAAFSDGMERVVDLAEVNGRTFVNNSSMGLYARIVRSPEYRDAKLKTAAGMLPDMLGPDAEPFDLHFTGPDGTRWECAHMLLVSNNPYQLDHLLGAGTRARMDTGQLGIVAARIDGPPDALAFISLEAAGRIRSFPGWVEWSAPSFEVDSAGPIDIGIDGETFQLDPPVRFTIQPAALRVRVPRTARVGVAEPVQVRAGLPTVVALARIILGRQ